MKVAVTGAVPTLLLVVSIPTYSFLAVHSAC